MTEVVTVSAPRSRLGSVSGWAAVITALLLVVGWFADWPYLFMLSVWFLFWLALGHWWLCVSLWLTQWHVRLIDYLYLGAAAISIVLAASNYRQERSQYAQMLDDVFVPADRAGLKAYVDQERDAHCSGTPGKFAPQKFCEWLDTLTPFLDTHYTVSDLEIRTKEGHGLIEAERWDSWWLTLRLFSTYREDEWGRRNMVQPDSFEQRDRLFLQTELQAGRVTRIILRSMEKIAEAETASSGGVVTRHNPAPEGFIPAVRGLGFTVVWPLVLIFALAIRFIKVTAEVSGWVK